MSETLTPRRILAALAGVLIIVLVVMFIIGSRDDDDTSVVVGGAGPAPTVTLTPTPDPNSTDYVHGEIDTGVDPTPTETANDEDATYPAGAPEIAQQRAETEKVAKDWAGVFTQAKDPSWLQTIAPLTSTGLMPALETIDVRNIPDLGAIAKVSSPADPDGYAANVTVEFDSGRTIDFVLVFEDTKWVVYSYTPGDDK